MLSLILAAVATCVQSATAPAASNLMPTQLRCEYLANPIGIDAARPRLSWALESKERGQHQTAYQIRVTVNAESRVTWDSDRVESAEQNQIEYNGPALQSQGITAGYHLFNAAPYILTLAIMIITCSPKRTLTGAPAELSITR